MFMELIKNLKKMMKGTDDAKRAEELGNAIKKIKSAKKELMQKRVSEHKIYTKLLKQEKQMRMRKGFGKNYFTEVEKEKRLVK